MSESDSSTADEPDPGDNAQEPTQPKAAHARVVDLSAHHQSRNNCRVRVSRVETEPMSPQVEAEVVDLLGVLIDQWATSQQQTATGRTTTDLDQRAA